MLEDQRPKRRIRVRFPLRTLILMIFALLATLRFIWISYERSEAQRRAAQPDRIIDVRPLPPENGDR